MHLPVSPDSELLREGAVSGVVGASHCQDDETSASQVSTPNSPLFPKKSQGMTVRSSLYPGKVHGTN